MYTGSVYGTVPNLDTLGLAVPGDQLGERHLCLLNNPGDIHKILKYSLLDLVDD